MKNIAILGSTGSIGRQALEVVTANPDEFRVRALTACSHDLLLEQQIENFRPDIAVLTDLPAAERLKNRYRGSTKILGGENELLAAATWPSVDMVLVAVVGFAGLKPTLAAIDAGKNIALANKETLVAGGELVMGAAREKRISLIPVDSEHSAIWQCLQGENRQAVSKIILTASGGPFRGRTLDQLAKVTVADCLKHPNWSMGPKITVDSATLINKGLEIIEARWLFGIDYSRIEVLVQPESVIHSMVEFVDGAVIAQCGRPDMRLPIQYALTYPHRLPASYQRLNFADLAAIHFEPPDMAAFPGLRIAWEAGICGGTMPCVLSAANEVAVRAFLAGRLPFREITEVIKQVINLHKVIKTPDVTQLVAADSWARATASRYIMAGEGIG